jgi:hypothetical protein
MLRHYATGWAAFMFIVLVTGIAVGCIVFYGILDRAPPRSNIIGMSSKAAFHACDFYEGFWKLDYLHDRPGRVIRRLTSGTDPKLESFLSTEDVRVVTTRPRVVPAAGIKVPVASFRIPCDFPPGLAYYQVTVEFYNNWLQAMFPVFSVKVEYPVIEFTVLPPASTGLLLRKF